VPVRTAMWESTDGYGARLAASLGLTREQLLVAGLPATMGITTGRLMPAKVAALIAYLASPLAASTTGADRIIDGGAIKTA
jgi:NAD(P)-dependent dehydrogenase (short-subunit alcohol dehydrogenase family)